MEYLNHVLHVANVAAQRSAAVLVRDFGKAEVKEKEKSSYNLVTAADIESEETIAHCIHEHFPGHAIVREEGDSSGRLDHPHLWIVDPLDGTNNYAHGIPHFCLSIGYAEEGQLQVGVVVDPLRGEWFTAVRGNGAKVNGKSIEVSRPAGLHEAIVATGFYYDRGQIMQQTLESIGKLFRQNVRGIRRMGAAALDLSWVACGRFDGFFEYKLAPWDYAAGSLIVQESGGRCADRQGNTLTLEAGSIVAATPGIFGALCEVVRWPEAAR